MTDTPEPPENVEETGPEAPAPHGPQISIAEEMKNSFIDYAMSVIISRAIPDLRDGLKPTIEYFEALVRAVATALADEAVTSLAPLWLTAMG